MFAKEDVRHIAMDAKVRMNKRTAAADREPQGPAATSPAHQQSGSSSRLSADVLSGSVRR
jgi:hypothetical protein